MTINATVYLSNLSMPIGNSVSSLENVKNLNKGVEGVEPPFFHKYWRRPFNLQQRQVWFNFCSFVQNHIFTHTHTFIQTNIHTHTQSHPCSKPYIQTITHTFIQMHICTTHTHIYMFKTIYSHIYTHSYKHTHTNTHSTHTHV